MEARLTAGGILVASNPNTEEQLQQAVDLITEHGSAHFASRASGIPEATLRNRYHKAMSDNYTPGKVVEPASEKEIRVLKNKLRTLNLDLQEAERKATISEDVQQKIFKIAQMDPEPPSWTFKASKSSSSPGIPTLLCSDWHWGEVINPAEIGGVPNKYNLRIANQRANRLVDSTIDLLTNHMVNPHYEGIHLMLGGDLFSGTIHDLSETNEVPMMKAFSDLYSTLREFIDTLLKHFPKVHISGVVGNHGRTSMKPKTKQRALTNFDWLMYTMLQAHYHPSKGKVDKRVTFIIPEAADVLIPIYNHRYLFTHGDQFRGGDGIIGPIGPIIRGDVKKRARNMQVGQDYDTLVIGHWHRYISTRQVIVNGSLCGYNEYAFLSNFPYEPPIQALWITHATKGITFQMPVYV